MEVIIDLNKLEEKLKIISKKQKLINYLIDINKDDNIINNTDFIINNVSIEKLSLLCHKKLYYIQTLINEYKKNQIQNHKYSNDLNKLNEYLIQILSEQKKLELKLKK